MSQQTGPFYADLGDLSEDTRVNMIGATATAGKIVAFIVEDDVKADRYLKKMRQHGYDIRVVERGKGPVKNTVFVKVGPAES